MTISKKIYLFVLAGFLFSSHCLSAQLPADTSALEFRAMEFRNSRAYDSALVAYRQAMEEYSAARDTAGQVRSAIGISDAYLGQRALDPALNALTSGLPFPAESIPDPFLRATLFESIANVHYYKYDAFSALENYTHYYDYLKDASPEGEEFLQATRIMTIYHLNAGLMARALEYATEFKERAVSLKGQYSDESADASNFLGMLSRYTGEPQVSLLHYEQALAIATELNAQGANLPSNILLSNIGMLYMNELEQPEKAISYFRESRDFLLAHGSRPYALGQIHSRFAQYYAGKSQYDSAYYHIDRGIELLRQADRAEMGLYGMLAHKADFYFEQERYDEALTQLDEATRYRYNAIPGNTTYNWATDQQKGKVWLHMDRPDSALHYFHKALVSYLPDLSLAPGEVPGFAPEHPEKLIVTKILHGKAKAYHQLAMAGAAGNDTLAFSHYRGTLTWMNRMRAAFVFGESKVFISENMQQIIDEAIELAFALYQQSGDRMYMAFIHDMIETNKWVQLKEELLAGQARNPGALVYADRLDFLQKRLEFVNKQLNDRGISSSDSVDLVARRLGLEKEIAGIKRDHFMSEPAPVASLSDIRTGLPEGMVISEFLLGKDRIHQLLIMRDTVVYLAHDERTVREQEVHKFRQALLKGDPVTYNQLGVTLYNQYVAPAISLSKHGLRRQVVIPDGFINNLPFDALLTRMPPDDRQFDSGPLLIRQLITTKHFMAASLPDAAKSQEKVTGQVLAFSPNFTEKSLKEVNTRAEELTNLPFAIRECESVTSRFGGSFLKGHQATETAFKNSSGSAGIIHLATHAIMEEDNPDRSRLLLFADSVNDGMLYSYEINTLDLNSELVALSACNTGVGEYRTGEGNMSLARGFYLAGTKSVLMSLWTVDDHSTAALMEKFYAHLDEGLAKDEALHRAKLDMIEEADNIHRNPYYWAGFDIIGDVSPVREANSSTYIWLSLGAILLAGAGILWFRATQG